MQEGLSSWNFFIFINVFSIYFSCKPSWSNPCRNSPDDNQQVLRLGRCFCCPWTGFFVLLLFVDWSTKCQQAHDWSIKVWMNIVQKPRNKKNYGLNNPALNIWFVHSWSQDLKFSSLIFKLVNYYSSPLYSWPLSTILTGISKWKMNISFSKFQDFYVIDVHVRAM